MISILCGDVAVWVIKSGPMADDWVFFVIAIGIKFAVHGLTSFSDD